MLKKGRAVTPSTADRLPRSIAVLGPGNGAGTRGTQREDHPMPLNPTRVQAVFLEATDYHDPVDRAAILDRECSNNPELRRRVEALQRMPLDSRGRGLTGRFLSTWVGSAATGFACALRSDDTDARKATVRRFGRSHRRAQGDRSTLRSIRPKRAAPK
jgi:hypothetical protein